MFIELTDHLKCPEDHDEAFLVLLPSRMEGRTVLEGHLGCPICGKTVDLQEGVVDFGRPQVGPGQHPGVLTAEHARTLLGLSGPGGYIALVGSAGSLAEGLASMLPGIQLIVVNPMVMPSPRESPANVVLAPRLPLKASSMRGVVLGAGLPDSWVRDGIQTVLHGLRIVGEGSPPVGVGEIEILAVTDEVWVGRRC